MLQPTKLAIFDFDSTLFLSPLFSGNLWDAWLVNAVTTENLFGPGFWRDIRSLSLARNDGDFAATAPTKATDLATKLVESAWDGWWNEDVVVEARRAIQDPQVLTVLLTGRRVHPFAGLVKQMLSTKGLAFDILGLRPDPASPSTDNNGLDFNEIPDTFLTTMDFKACFILHLRSKVTSLQEIVMWDDRPSHLPVLKRFVAGLIKDGYFQHGSVESVMAVRPRYNPEWEIKLVTTILESHNHALQQTDDRPVPPVSVVVDDDGNSVDSYDLVRLVRRPTATPVLRLTPASIENVRRAFAPSYQQHHQSLEALQPDWQYRYGEQPVFFGDLVFDTSVSSSTLNCLHEQRQVSLVVVGWDTRRTSVFGGADTPAVLVDHGLTLSVRVEGLSSSTPDENPLILPLWYRPSTFQKLPTQSYQWTHSPGMYDGLRLTAHVDHLCLYGIEKKETETP